MAGWLPIESAPRDGTWILLASPPEKHERDTWQIYVATWGRLSYSWDPQWVYGPNGREHSFRSGVYDATHWMPLPDPPKEGGGVPLPKDAESNRVVIEELRRLQQEGLASVSAKRNR